MGNYNLATRAHAVRCYFKADGVMDRAVQLFNEGWDSERMNEVKSQDALRKFIRYQIIKFMRPAHLKTGLTLLHKRKCLTRWPSCVLT
jgi:hypothetical protein